MDIETNRQTNAEKEVLMLTRFLDGRSSLNTLVLKTSHWLETVGLAVLLKETLEYRTEVRFASFLSGGFTIMAVINPPERKLAKCTSVHR